MPSVALIAEGLTDQIVITRLMQQMYLPANEEDRIQINPLQPIRDASDAHHAPHAGWEKVFEYCEHSMEDALATNDYVVVQVDTDQGDHLNYGLPLTEGGADRSYADLIEGARALLIGRMGEVATEAALARIIFAVSVHATESWLLLILYGEDRLKSPFERLVHLVQKKEGWRLKKEARPYGELMRAIKAKAIRPYINSAHSMGVFLCEFGDKVNPEQEPQNDNPTALADA